MGAIHSALIETRKIMSIPEFISCIIVLYIQPILCLIGILFNSACLGVFIMVWSNRDYYRKTAMILYLGAMSLCNILQLLLSFPVIISPAFEQFIDENKFPNEARAIEQFNSEAVKLFYPLLMASNYSSIWLLVLICAHRFHSICHPNNKWKRKLYFIVHQSKLCICLWIVFAIVINSIRWWELENIKNNENINEQEEKTKESFLRFSTLYIILQEGFLYGFCVYILPFFILIWLNLNTLQIISDSTKNQQQYISRQQAEHRTAKMTFVVFGAFFGCTTMAVLLRFVIIIFGNLFQFSEFAWLPDLSNLLMNTNCLIMPVVCFLFTRGFRDIFFAIRDRNRRNSALIKTNILNKKQQKCFKKLFIENEKI